MGLSLYDINDKLAFVLENAIDPDTGEMLDGYELDKLLDELELDLNTKIENTLCFCKSLNAEIEAFKTEEKNLKQRRVAKENLAERLRSRIDQYIRLQHMDEDGGILFDKLNKYKFETPKVKVSYRKSQVVNIDDLSAVDSKYIKERKITESDVNKTQVKDDLKANLDVLGCSLNDKLSMQVK